MVGSILDAWIQWLIGCIFIVLVSWWLLVVAGLVAEILGVVVVVVVSREM